MTRRRRESFVAHTNEREAYPERLPGNLGGTVPCRFGRRARCEHDTNRGFVETSMRANTLMLRWLGVCAVSVTCVDCSTAEKAASNSQASGGSPQKLPDGGTDTGGSANTGGAEAVGGVANSGTADTGGAGHDSTSTGGAAISSGGTASSVTQGTGGSIDTSTNKGVGGNDASGATGGVLTATSGTGHTSIATGGTSGGSTSSPATTVVQTPNGTTSYSPPQYLPNHSDGVPSTVQWIHCATLIVKDNLGADLVGLFRGTQSLHAAVSTDSGATWKWVDPTPAVDVDPPLALAQGADGNIHVVSWSWSRGASYSRISLNRDAEKHVNGFSAAVSAVKFPIELNFADLSADIVAGVDQAGNPTLFYSVYDNYGTPDGGRVFAGKTTAASGHSPTASKDFVALDDTSGATRLDSMSGDSWAAPHNAGVLMAQHPVSKDIWYQWGPLNTWDGLTQNTLPLKRLRATPSGASTFAAGAIETVATFQGTGVQNYAVTSTPKSVWFLYGTPASAVIFDRASADGSVTKNALPSPYDAKNSGGFFTMSINQAETEVWLAGQPGWDTNDPNAKKTWAKYWNGSSWSTFDVRVTNDELFRMARSAGWDNGLAFVQSRLDYESWRPAIGALRTIPKN